MTEHEPMQLFELPELNDSLKAAIETPLPPEGEDWSQAQPDVVSG